MDTSWHFYKSQTMTDNSRLHRNDWNSKMSKAEKEFIEELEDRWVELAERAWEV